MVIGSKKAASSSTSVVVVADLAGGAAHDARQPDHVVVAVDDHAVLAGVAQPPASPGEFALDPVEGLECLALARRGRADGPSRHLRGVVGVRGLTQFEHDEVRRVHDVRDRTHARALQAPRDPRG